MATNTPNYALVKPDATDSINITHINDNMDAIDEALKGIDDKTKPINQGGTGATTAPQALINLGLNATAEEMNCVEGATGNIQGQIDDIDDKIGNVGWKSRISTNSTRLKSVAYGNGIYVAITDGSTTYTSLDGIVWVEHFVISPHKYNTITYANGLFIRIGTTRDGVGNITGGSITTSPDGVNWTTRTSGTMYELYSVAYGNGLYVVTAVNGKIFTSPDLITWTLRTSGTTSILHSVTYGEGLYIIACASGAILTSPDGITWTIRTSGTTNILTSVTYGNGIFIAVGTNGIIITSPDGITWNVISTGDTTLLNSVNYRSGRYTAVGDLGKILTSPDGIIWGSISSGYTAYLNCIIYGNEKYVVVGDNRTILTSSTVDESISDLNSKITTLGVTKIVSGGIGVVYDIAHSVNLDYDFVLPYPVPTGSAVSLTLASPSGTWGYKMHHLAGFITSAGVLRIHMQADVSQTYGISYIIVVV